MKQLDYPCLITIIYLEPFLWIQKDLVRIIRKLVKYQIYFFSYLTLTSSAAVLKALAHTVSTILTMSCNRLWSSKMAKISWNSPNDNVIAAAASEKKKIKWIRVLYIIQHKIGNVYNCEMNRVCTFIYDTMHVVEL